MKIDDLKKGFVGLVIFSMLFLTCAANTSAFTAVRKDTKDIVDKVSRLSMPFLENRGQITGGSVKYYSRTFWGTLFVTDGGRLVYSFQGSKNKKDRSGCVISEQFLGNRPDVRGIGRTTTRVSFFKGRDIYKWKRGVPTYDAVKIGEYHGGARIRVRAYGNNVEKLFFIPPLGDLSCIRVRIQGAKGLSVDQEGKLKVDTGKGVIRFTKPEAYQVVKGNRHTVNVCYEVKGNEYGFKVQNYDRSRPLIIDPLLASTFIGGSSYENAFSTVVDNSGNVYVAGTTSSSDFPYTNGAFDTSWSGGDAFIAKFNSDLSNMLACSFLGGNHDDRAICISLDNEGNLIVAGDTYSSDFPFIQGAYDSSFGGGGNDAFIAKLDGSLSTLICSTFLGGSNQENLKGIATDSSGNILVTGYTKSHDFPVTGHAYIQAYSGGYNEGFVAKLDSNLSNLIASTFLGGSGGDWAQSIAVDGSDNIFVAGYTTSSDFPVLSSGYDNSFNGGGQDAFVAKLSSDLSRLVSATFLGGSDDEFAYCVVADNSGDILVSGMTRSSDFPVTDGAYDITYSESGDAFIARLSNNLGNLLASTFLGGNGSDDACSIVVGDSGEIIVSGNTHSSDFPVTSGSYDRFYGGEEDGFIAKMNSNLTSMLASTYLGGNHDDYACSLAVSRSGAIYIAGQTESSSFPTTSGAFDPSFNGDTDAFVAKLDVSLSRTLYYYIPHVVQNEIWWSAIGIENIGPTSATVAFNAYDKDGNFLEKSGDIVIPPMGNKAVVAGNIFGGNLPTGTSSLQLASSGGKIVGFELFGTWDMRRSAYVPIFSGGRDDLYFPHIAETATWGTGVAIQNVGCGSATVRFRAYNENGQFLGESGEFSIARLGNLVTTVSTLFSGVIPPGTASLQAISNGGELVGFELFGTLDGEILTGVPAAMK